MDRRQWGSRRLRGTALVEFALLLPLTVLLLTAGQWGAELLVVKLKLREAARFAAWETAAYPQTDLAGGEPTQRPARVREAALRRASLRYSQILHAGQGERLLAHGGEVRFTLQPSALAWDHEGGGSLRPDAGGRASLVAAMVRSSPLEFPARWGLAAPQWLTAEASAEVRMPRLGLPGPRPAFGGTYRFSERVAVITDAWFLPDGGDSTVVGASTGVHPDGQRSGLWMQVRRMRMLGRPGLLQPERIAATALTTLMPFTPPQFDGAFVVDHALGREVRRGCEGVPGYPREALSGLRDFGAAVEEGAPRCFGTQPLRETQAYEGSLQLQALRARGANFLGCPNPGADDPSRASDQDLHDSNVLKESCGGAP
ncbi:MAG: hypothetical protein M3Y59_16530 [Myxococcota bacterium]|nr:hypothetical protein [Myxococcota bacterium]